MQIKSSCPNHFLDHIRYEITDGLMVADTFPEKSCRNIQQRRINHSDIRMHLKLRKLRARSGIYVKPVIFENSFVVFPLHEVDEVILTHDNFKGFVRMFFREMNEGVDGIAWFGKVKLDVGSFNLVVIVDGGAYHIEPVEFVQQSFTWFEWILRRYYHPDLIEVGGFRHDVGNDQVTNVNGIERAEE